MLPRHTVRDAEIAGTLDAPAFPASHSRDGGSEGRAQPAQPCTAAEVRPGDRVKALLTTLGAVMGGALLVSLFFYLDRRGAVSHVITRLGPVGPLASIVLMALFCIAPIPTEFLLILNMRVFGVWMGIFYSWIGALCGATIVFFIARHMGMRLMEQLVTPARLHAISAWVERRGAWGLLLIRLIPLPFIVVNYGVGMLRSVRYPTYLWTTAAGLIPFDVASALLYMGVSHRYVMWIAVGGVTVVAIWLIGYLLQRRNAKARAA